MYRLLRDLLSRSRSKEPTVDAWEPVREARQPDPYVWRLPSVYEARWRRWFKRSRAAGHHTPFPAQEACWATPSPARAPSWQTDDDVVRPYVICPPDPAYPGLPCPPAERSHPGAAAEMYIPVSVDIW